MGTSQRSGLVATGKRNSKPEPNTNTGAHSYADACSNAYSNAYSVSNTETNGDASTHADTNAFWWRKLCRCVEFDYTVLRGRRGQCGKQQLHCTVLQPRRESDHCGQ